MRSGLGEPPRPAARGEADRSLPVLFSQCVLRGVGQIVFQRNAVAGVCILAGVSVNSAVGGAALLGGAVLATTAALLLRFPAKALEDGLFGFNGALVGVAVAFFFEPSVWSGALVLVGAPGSAVVTRLMQRLPLPPFTAPFVLVTWVLWLAGTALDLSAAPRSVGITTTGQLGSILTGLGQILFQESVLTGASCLAGVLVGARLTGLWAPAGALVGGFVGILAGSPAAALASGLLGYNAALAALALVLDRPRWIWPLAAAALTVPILGLFSWVGIPALTAPFVLAAWAALAAAKTVEKSFRIGRHA